SRLMQTKMFQDFFDNPRFFNTSDGLHVTVTLITFLNFYVDGRPVKTRFNRCAQYMPYPFGLGTSDTNLPMNSIRLRNSVAPSS
ncbi:MAG: hypothetical protein ACI805_001486, partial [Candidatus Azotimanducaceae bacterium]